VSLDRIFPILNQMEADGIIGRYAIGGAVGAIFWLEPMLTKGLDVFVALPTSSGGLLTLSAIYDYLLARGYQPRGQHIEMEGWLVEFVPPGTPLVEEALARAVVRDVDGVPVRVFTAEHLAAISLQVGRAQDHDRIARFRQHEALDAVAFEDILRRHQLLDKWRQLPEQ
jgi:hypothetical protein